jgi:hypothetical protein
MIDTATGEAIAGQRWEDPAAFEQQCCFDSEFVWVGRTGGVVVAVNGRRIAVWYPAAADLPASTATLP